MRVEIIELLRCPAAHESSPLITVAHSRDGEQIVDATLGCVVCGAEYPLRDGVAYLGVTAQAIATDTSHATVDAMRAAALLGLSEPGMRVVLCGAYASVADEVERQTGAVAITVNAEVSVQSGSHADHIVLGRRDALPLATASVSALAVDDVHLALLADAARVVRPGGRVLAPASSPVSVGLRELARDEREWIVVVESTMTAPVTLRRVSSASDRSDT